MHVNVCSNVKITVVDDCNVPKYGRPRSMVVAHMMYMLIVEKSCILVLCNNGVVQFTAIAVAICSNHNPTMQYRRPSPTCLCGMTIAPHMHVLKMENLCILVMCHEVVNLYRNCCCILKQSLCHHSAFVLFQQNFDDLANDNRTWCLDIVVLCNIGNRLHVANNCSLVGASGSFDNSDRRVLGVPCQLNEALTQDSQSSNRHQKYYCLLFVILNQIGRGTLPSVSCTHDDLIGIPSVRNRNVGEQGGRKCRRYSLRQSNRAVIIVMSNAIESEFEKLSDKSRKRR